MEFVNTFEQHHEQPDISLEQYTKKKRLQLGEEITNYKKIYLDTNYWLELRNTILGRPKNNYFVKLLELLRNGVKVGKLICPISDENYYEILQQTDPVTLNASANLIDDLSKGIVLLSTEERIQSEILYFIRSLTNNKTYIHHPNVFVWSKVSYVFGVFHPKSISSSPEEELVIQKAFFDQMWSISLMEMLETIGIENILTMPRYNDISNKLNESKIQYAHENNSFKQLYLSELAGELDFFQYLFEDALIYIFEEKNGHRPTIAEVQEADSGKKFANSVYHIFEKNKLGTYFPSLVINAGLHASVRQNVNRKFKKNDFSDFRHAQAAIPYFDCMFTEHSLRDLVSRKNIAFDKKYNCNVLSDPSLAVECVTKIIN